MLTSFFNYTIKNGKSLEHTQSSNFQVNLIVGVVFNGFFDKMVYTLVWEKFRK